MNCHFRIVSFTFLFFCLVFLHSCVKEPEKTNDNSISITENHNVLVVNEGNFMWGNAELSLFNLKTDSLSNGIFSQINSKPLGDVAQSATLIDQKIYVVVNNSGKVEVLNAKDLTLEKTISGFTSPRYMIEANPGELWVSDLYANKITIIDKSNYTKLTEIPVSSWTEQMLVVNNHVYVSAVNKSLLYVIDKINKTIKDSIAVHRGGSDLIKFDNYFFLLCSGSSSANIPGALYKFSNSDHNDYEYIEFPQGRFPSNLTIDVSNEELLWSEKNQVFKMPVNFSSLPQTPMLTLDNANIYGMNYHKDYQVLLIADAKDYVSNGDVFMVNSHGEIINKITVGIIPSQFLFF